MKTLAKVLCFFGFHYQAIGMDKKKGMPVRFCKRCNKVLRY